MVRGHIDALASGNSQGAASTYTGDVDMDEFTPSPHENQALGYCQCGCGQKTNTYRGKVGRFVRGHNARIDAERPASRRLIQTDANGMRACTKCGELLPRTIQFFVACKRYSDGLYPYCRKCAAIYAAQTRTKNREKIRARAREYQRRWAQVPENKKRVEQWRETHRTEAVAATAQWRKNNPEKCRALAHTRRLRTHNRGRFTGADIQALYDLQAGTCFYCDALLGAGYHVDHWMPLALGGSNTASNIVLSCPTCNTKKSDQHPLVWWMSLMDWAENGDEAL